MKCLSRLFRFSSVLLESFYKLYVYGKRQTSGSNWEFLKIENEKNNKSSIIMDKKLSETTYLCVEIMNSKRQVYCKGETWSRGTSQASAFRKLKNA